MLTTIKDRCRYNPVFYDWMTDWTFIDREERQFLDLLVSAEVTKDKLQFQREDTGVSIMAVAYR